jgi:hypothetical protein
MNVRIFVMPPGSFINFTLLISKIDNSEKCSEQWLARGI